MQFSSISAFGALFAVASASLYTTDVAVVCSGADPTTVYQTVTVTAPYHSITNAPYSGGNSNYVASTAPYVTTVGKTVTSVDYTGSQTSVWVYPTGSSSHDCTVAIYEKTTIINVIIVNINISIVNGETKIVTSTVAGAHPTFTPVLPPLHNWNTTSSTKSTPTSTGYHNSTTKSTSSSTSMHMGTGISSKTTTTTSSSMRMNTGISSKSTSSSTSMHMGTATTSSTSKSTSSFTTSTPYGTGNVDPITYTGVPTLSVHATPSVAITSAAPKGRRAEAWFA